MLCIFNSFTQNNIKRFGILTNLSDFKIQTNMQKNILDLSSTFIQDFFIKIKKYILIF